MYTDIIVLGSLTSGSAHGYEIKRRLTEILGGRVELNNNTIYPALRRFTEAGAVTKAEQPQQGRPPRHVYTLTSTGWELLHDMLVEFGSEQAGREEEFLTRVGFFHLLDPGERQQVLDARLAALGRVAARLESLLDRIETSPSFAGVETDGATDTRRWSRQVVEHTLAQTEQEREWIHSMYDATPDSPS